jgi:hypothetical protein
MATITRTMAAPPNVNALVGDIPKSNPLMNRDNAIGAKVVVA